MPSNTGKLQIDFIANDDLNFDRLGVFRFEICRYDAEDCLSVPIAVVEFEGTCAELKPKVEQLVPLLVAGLVENELLEITISRRCWCGIGSA